MGKCRKIIIQVGVALFIRSRGPGCQSRVVISGIWANLAMCALFKNQAQQFGKKTVKNNPLSSSA